MRAYQDPSEFQGTITENFRINPSTAHKNVFVSGSDIACSGVNAVFRSPDASEVFQSKLSQDLRTHRLGPIQGGGNVHAGSLEIIFDKDVVAVGIPVHGLIKCEVRIYNQAGRELGKEILVMSLVDGFVGVIAAEGFRSVKLKTSNPNWALQGVIIGELAK